MMNLKGKMVRFTNMFIMAFLPFFGFDSLFNGISIFEGYLMPNRSLSRESNGAIWPLTGGDDRVYSFPKSISLKENVIAPFKFELAYYDVAVQHVIHIHHEDSPLSVALSVTISQIH